MHCSTSAVKNTQFAARTPFKFTRLEVSCIHRHTMQPVQGTIDFKNVYQLLDSIAMMNGTKHWTADDNYAMHNWMGQYAEYLTTEHVMPERRSINNHGSYYDLQYVSVLRYASRLHEYGSAGALRNDSIHIPQKTDLYHGVPMHAPLPRYTGILGALTKLGTISTPTERSAFACRCCSSSAACWQWPFCCGL